MKNVKGRPEGSLTIFFITILILLSMTATPVFAGFNDTMDTVLAQEKLTLGAASFILLTGAGLLDDSATLEEAAVALSDQIPGISSSYDQEITLGAYSFYAMEVYQIKGGLMYKLFPGPRYALREFRFLKLVQSRAFSRMTLSGERAVRILGRILSMKEAQS